MTKVFLCWSGKRSRAFAAIVSKELKKILGSANVQPSMSTQIAKGTEWYEELRSALDDAACGILCLTAEAVHSPWVHFEAGLLARALSRGSSSDDESLERRVFPLLCDGVTDLQGPLSVYQATSARDRDDVLRLLEAVAQVVRPSGRNDRKALRESLKTRWDGFQKEISDIPKTDLEEVFPGFGELFRRKTFDESMYDCLSQRWLDRYDGARDVHNRLKATKNTVAKACRQFVVDVYGEIMTSLDSYAMGLSRLIGSHDAPIDEGTGRLRFDNPGIAAACERQRKRIRSLVAKLGDPDQFPTFDEAFQFANAETFEEKKRLVHRRHNLLDKMHPSRRESPELERCAASGWDFDRIVYYGVRVKRPQLPADIARSWQEFEKANARADGVSLMALKYSLDPIEAALAAPVSERDAAEVRRLVNDVRALIKRTKSDGRGQVRALLGRIKSKLKDNAAASPSRPRLAGRRRSR